MGVPTPPAVLPTSVPVDVASPLSHVVCSLGPVDVSTGPAVLEHSSSSSPVPCLRGLVESSVEQSRPNCTKMLAEVSSKSADLHGQSSPSELSSHQISRGAGVPAHSSPSELSSHQIPLGARVRAHSTLATREVHDDSRATHCREKNSSQLVSDTCLPVCAAGPRSRHKDTSPRRSKVLSLFADRSQAPLFRAGADLLSGTTVHLEEIDISLWQLDKARKWTTPAKNLLFQVQQGNFDLVCVTLPVHGMSRALFANSSGPSPLRSRRYPYGFPWLTAQCKRAVDAITIQAATLMVYAFATMTQRSTGLLLFASEERGEAHFGEPCSWWQSTELQLMSNLGAHRGAFYTCEIAKKWGVTNLSKAGSMGVLSNFQLPVSCAVGWPRINENREYKGPLSAKCSCGTPHDSIKNQRASSAAIHSTVCAEFLSALHRLPEEKGELNTSCSNGLVNAVFSPVQDSDSPALFLLLGQPWLQALLRSFSVPPVGICPLKDSPVAKKRKLSDLVGEKEQSKSSKSDRSSVGFSEKTVDVGNVGAVSETSNVSCESGCHVWSARKVEICSHCSGRKVRSCTGSRARPS